MPRKNYDDTKEYVSGPHKNDGKARGDVRDEEKKPVYENVKKSPEER